MNPIKTCVSSYLSKRKEHPSVHFETSVVELVNKDPPAPKTIYKRYMNPQYRIAGAQTTTRMLNMFQGPENFQQKSHMSSAASVRICPNSCKPSASNQTLHNTHTIDKCGRSCANTRHPPQAPAVKHTRRNPKGTWPCYKHSKVLVLQKK